MGSFKESVKQVFKGAAKTFQIFPAANACALAFAIVTMVRIQLDWPQQEPYNFLFNCLHLAFAFGALFSLASITAVQSRINKAKAFLIANILGIVGAVIAFLALYFLGVGELDKATGIVLNVSGLASVRISMAMLVSFVAFIYLAGYPQEQFGFSRSLFMVEKAFFIAFIYGMAIMAGTSGVAGAIQALLYRGMSEKVYMYLSTIAGFLAFTIFVGYFPDFRKDQVDPKREIAQKQPRFIEVLFEYIMIPIMLALTVVLILWAGKTVVTGSWPEFYQLSSIATSYTLVGIWLHIMVTEKETGLAKFYRRAYPIAALVILAFEAWALVNQIIKSGLKTGEYYFALVWILAVAAVIMLLIKKAKAHTMIAAMICGLAIFSVLPIVGYQALPVTWQVNRLETLLINENILQDGKLVPAATEPSKDARIAITDAVNYLAYAESTKLPVWFDKDLGTSTTFKEKLGFEQIWAEPDNTGNQSMSIFLMLPNSAIDISDYRWGLSMQNFKGDMKAEAVTTIDGTKGSYQFTWIMDYKTGIPTLKVTMDGRVLVEENMKGYVDQLTAKYPPGQGGQTEASVKDMTLKLETTELDILLVFNSVDMYVDPQNDVINYGINLNSIYVNEK